jgi:hypothetical protein
MAAALAAVALAVEDAAPGVGCAGVLLLESPVEAEAVAPVELGDATGVVHAGVLHACDDAPTHAAPPPDGAGFVQVRTWVQSTEHAPKADHPPSTTAGHDE